MFSELYALMVLDLEAARANGSSFIDAEARVIRIEQLTVRYQIFAHHSARVTEIGGRTVSESYAGSDKQALAMWDNAVRGLDREQRIRLIQQLRDEARNLEIVADRLA